MRYISPQQPNTPNVTFSLQSRLACNDPSPYLQFMRRQDVVTVEPQAVNTILQPQFDYQEERSDWERIKTQEETNQKSRNWFNN